MMIEKTILGGDGKVSNREIATKIIEQVRGDCSIGGDQWACRGNHSPLPLTQHPQPAVPPQAAGQGHFYSSRILTQPSDP